MHCLDEHSLSRDLQSERKKGSVMRVLAGRGALRVRRILLWLSRRVRPRSPWAEILDSSIQSRQEQANFPFLLFRNVDLP